MKIWTAIKRLNQNYDAWAIRAANKVVDDLDHRGAASLKPRNTSAYGTFSLTAAIEAGGEGAMRFTSGDWKMPVCGAAFLA